MSTREQLEQAISNLEAQRDILGDATVDVAIDGIKIKLAALMTTPPASPKKQRKQVTVLFADVSGFTIMSEQMDAEDVSDTMNALWRQVDAAITDHNGHIDKHIGDAVMALWGVDEAREDDPEQAIRAALSMQAAIKNFSDKQDIDLKMRIGLNTGFVLLDQVGTTAEFTAIGDTVNTASRLEHAAPIGGILISYNTYRHVHGLFEVVLQAPLTVKGKASPIQVYIVQKAKPRAFRNHTRGVEGIKTRMVGRDDELQLLQKMWQDSLAQSQTTLTTIIGDAGVGKSRLLYEFEAWLTQQTEAIVLFKGRCAEQTQGSPYFLLRDLLATHFGIRESDPIAEVRQKFETGIGKILSDEADMKAHFLGQWLGYDYSHSPYIATIQGNAEQLKNRGILYLTQFLTRLAQVQPVTIFFEDIHWADTRSLNVLLDVVRHQPELPLQFIMLTRPSLFDHRPDWRTLGQEETVKIEGIGFVEPVYQFITLTPLPSAADRELLAEILQKIENIPESLFELVAGRAAGNPFYIEELVKMLIEDNVIITADTQWQVDISQLNESRIPSTLTGILQSRLDKLEANEKVTLQRASVVGRVFWDTVIAQLGDDPNQVELPSLLAHDLIFAQPDTAFANTTQYLFKHDILRDVTYQTVLKKARQKYHGQVAQWLVNVAKKNGRSDEYAAVIATHFEIAKAWSDACVWYEKAGHIASAQYADDDALKYLTLALKFTPKTEIAKRFALLETCGQIHIRIGIVVFQKDLTEFVSLAEQLGPREQARAAFWQATVNFQDYDKACQYIQNAIAYAEQSGSFEEQLLGYWLYGNLLSFHRHYTLAQETYQKGLQMAQKIDNQEQVAVFLLALGKLTGVKNDFVAAITYYEHSLAISRKIGAKIHENSNLNNLGELFRVRGDYETALTYYEQSIAISRETGFRISRKIQIFNMGHIFINQGKVDIADTCYKQSLRLNRKFSNLHFEANIFNQLGVVALTQANIQLAETYFQQALTISQAHKFAHLLVETWAGLAKVKLTQKENEDAQQYTQQILDYLHHTPHLDGSEMPFRIFHFTWQVLMALNRSTEANQVLSLAAQMIQNYLDTNNEADLHKMYLAQPNHKGLWTAWQKLPKG